VVNKRLFVKEEILNLAINDGLEYEISVAILLKSTLETLAMMCPFSKFISVGGHPPAKSLRAADIEVPIN